MSETPEMTDTTMPVLDFDEWLSTGTVAQRTVELHNDPAVADDLIRLDARRAAAAKLTADESAVGDDYGLSAIDAEYEALYERWEASKETWLVRALDVDEIKALRAAHPVEKVPDQPGKNSPAGAKVEHERRMQEWAERATANNDALSLHHLSWAIVSLTTARGVARAVGVPLVDGVESPDFRPAITVAQLTAMHRTRRKDVTALYDAAAKAVTEDLEPAVPFSQRASENAPA